MSIEKNIKMYLVGFPKSGTSWLIRLMANLLEIPIQNNNVNMESTVEINQRLKLKSANSFIAKVHLLPNFFLSSINRYPEKIIYIHRDVRSVVISSFFYFKVPKRFSYLFLLQRDEKLSATKNLFRMVFYPFARIILSIYISKFLSIGIKGMNKDVGTWHQNIRKWREWGSKKQGITFISYEMLLDDPPSGVRRILKELNLPNVSEVKIQAAIASESFDAMKKRMKERPSLTESAKLRVGNKEDWKNYLTKGNLKELDPEIQYYQTLLNLQNQGIPL
jgi:hypothetical protein